MDEETEAVNKDCPWEILSITDDEFVFRQISVSQRETHRQKKIPLESQFSLRENEESLSFNLKSIIDVPKNFKLMGITYSKKQKFLDITSFKIFEFPVKFLRKLDKFDKINHTPQFDGAPSPVGKPNNKSHLSLFCADFDEGTRVQLKDFCRENDCECTFNINSIRQDIVELISRGNNTPFHNYWEFED